MGIPGRVVEDHQQPLAYLEHGRLPDPVAEVVRFVLREQEKLGERLMRLEGLCGLLVPKIELDDRKEKIVKEFAQGGGI